MNTILSEKEYQKFIMSRLLNLKLFVRDKLEEDNPKGNQQYPIKYTIFNKTYDFSTVYNVLVDQCERILDIKGSDALVEGLKKDWKERYFL